MASAFRDDPILGRLLASRSARGQVAYPAFFRKALREAQADGRVDGAWQSGRLVGVAAWFELGVSHVDRAARRSIATRVDSATTKMLFPRATRRIDAGFAELAALHPAETHWYLAFVGIAPYAQGHGVGSRLIGAGLELADAAGKSVYLETPFERTLPLYERLGFGLVERMPAAFNLAPLWRMLRPARIAT